MPLKDIVRINITSLTAGVTQAGFGIPLILSHTAAWVERTRTYKTADAVLADFPNQTSGLSPEYRAALKEFSQEPAPEKVIIGRASNKPTQRWQVDVLLVANSTDYKIRVGANTATYTSDANATNDEIVNGLLAAINALSGDTVTATTTGSAGSLDLVITGNAAGDWNDVEIMNTDLLTIAQNHADPGLAADLAAIKNENDEWYALVTMFNSHAYILAAAAWVEAAEKLYVVQSQDTKIINDAEGGGATDIAHALKAAAYARSAVIYHPATGGMADAAWTGACLPLDPGSETWKFKTLKTVTVTVVSATHQTNIEAKNANYYYTVAGQPITSQGKVAAGEFIDVVRFRDWVKARMSERIFGRLKNAKKVPFTDSGILVVENEVRGVLSDGIEAGGIAEDPAPTVTVPKASEVPNADKLARKLTGVKFKFTLAGAIHLVDPVEGEISV